MSTWINESVANNNANGIDPNAIMDPSAFMVNQGQINPAQFANQQPQQQQQQQQPSQQMAGVQGDAMRHASPSFQNTIYQPNSVIPSKRPRPREDSVSGSPHQAQGMLPPSRSETPQQQGFPAGQQGQGQFSHLQSNGSANASPSPNMSNQMRPGSVPQRVSTASPHPFSPGGQQQFGGQNSPAPSDHGTPQPNQFMQNMPPGYNQGFAPPPGGARPSPNPNAMAASQMMNQQLGQLPPGMNPNMYAQLQQQQQQAQQQQQQGQGQGQQQQPAQQQGPQGQQQAQQQKMAAYQMRLQQQLQGNMQNMQMQAMQAQGMGRGMMQGKQPMPGMPNGQMPPGAMRPQGRPLGGMNNEQFMKNLAALMAARGLPFDPNPTVGERPINLMMLFQIVSSKGGYKSVTANNGWPHMAQAIGLPLQHPQIPAALRSIYERNLLKFEEVWIAQQKQRMMQQQQQQQQAGSQPGTPQKPMQPGQQQMHPGQMTPGQQHMMQQQQQQQQQQQGQGQHTQQPPQQAPQPSPQTPQQLTQQQMMQQQQAQQQQLQQQAQQQQQHQQGQHPQHPQQQTPMKPPGQPPMNGFATPGQQPPQPGMHGHTGSISRGPMDPNMPHDPAMPSPAMQRPPHMGMDGQPGAMPPLEGRPAPAPKSEEYFPCLRELMTYGGLELGTTNAMGAELERWKPNVPPLNDLGNIDIQALTKSLECGIPSEVRIALDTLSSLSNSLNQHHFVQLRYCEGLVEALVDIAEEQLEKLAEHAAEVADEIQLTSYEDITRSCRMDRWAVRDLPAFGTETYELDRAVDRLICITTILRNLSFPGEANENHLILADEGVMKLLCDLIRYLGTRTMLLRNNNNTLDFMKDVIILLSNIAGSIELTSKEHAMSLLSFILAFAPSPGPTVVAGELLFTSYEPAIHPYLPHAIDALAKLLARDEPNRGFYKNIFGLETGSENNYELLTKTFALAVSPLPDKFKDHMRAPVYPSLVEARKPMLMQGLLAAEILAFMAPGFDSGVARSWLSPGNGLAANLSRLVQELSQMFEHPQLGIRGPPPPRGTQLRKDPELAYLSVVAVTLLRTLAEKARDRNHPEESIPKSILPASKALMEALTLQSPEWTRDGMLQQLNSIVNMAR